MVERDDGDALIVEVATDLYVCHWPAFRYPSVP